MRALRKSAKIPVLNFSGMGKKSSKDAVSVLEAEALINLREASRLTGYVFFPDKLRAYAADGSIPGARQVGRGKQWLFKRELFQKWWQAFNAPKPGEE
jgi:hypothetical protein